MGFSANELASHTHNFAKQFVEKYYPDEAVYFPLIWEKFLQQGKEIVSRKRKGFWTGLGLPFAWEKVPIKMPYILILVHAFFSEAKAMGQLPDLSKVQKIMALCAKETGMPDKILRQVMNDIGPEIQQYFERLASKGPLQMEEATFPGNDWAYMDYLVPGGYAKAERIPFSQINKIKSEQEYKICEIIVDEFDPYILLKPAQSETLKRHTAGMLWLVLTHVGHHVTQEKIGLLFGFNPRGDERVHLYRNYLLKPLGADLRNRAIKGAKDRQHLIPRNGWSFYWFRRYPDPKLSVLVHTYWKKGHLEDFNLTHYTGQPHG